jgi:hypothetical protein
MARGSSVPAQIHIVFDQIAHFVKFVFREQARHSHGIDRLERQTA